MIIRGILLSVTDGAQRVADFVGRLTKYGKRPFIQQYGFRSRPKANAEGVLVRFGDNMVIIASDDSRYIITLAEGEVALYTDEGDKIHLKRGRKIDIVAGDSTTPGLITVTAPGTTGKVIINAMNIELGAGALEKILMGESFQTLFNAHTHTAGFVTPTTPPVLPSTVLELSTVVKATK